MRGVCVWLWRWWGLQYPGSAGRERAQRDGPVRGSDEPAAVDELHGPAERPRARHVPRPAHLDRARGRPTRRRHGLRAGRFAATPARSCSFPLPFLLPSLEQKRRVRSLNGVSLADSVRFTGFHYVDWQFDGPDIIAAVRTAYRGAVSYHNSNRLTFRRFSNWRDRIMQGGSK